jgi:hypothetical protein
MLKTISKVLVILAMVVLVVGASTYVLPALADQGAQQGSMSGRDHAMAQDRDRLQSCDADPLMERDRLQIRDRLRIRDTSGNCTEDCPCDLEYQHRHGDCTDCQNQSMMGYQYHGDGGDSSPMGGIGMHRRGSRP